MAKRTSITVAVKRRLTVTTLLLVVGCSGCVRPIVSSDQTAFPAPVLLHPTMPQSLAVTTCSLNNRPVVLMDSSVWHSEQREMVLVHEQTHAQRAVAYRGGCWPFMYRIARDRDFRLREQLVAFCAAGRFAIQRNKNPESMWTYIVNVMAGMDTLLTEKDNCLYEPGGKQ
jgi:hypothetical protein